MAGFKVGFQGSFQGYVSGKLSGLNLRYGHVSMLASRQVSRVGTKGIVQGSTSVMGRVR